MLCDQDTINDVNPFVSRDFSLPGSVRQLGNFADRSLVKEKTGMDMQDTQSPYCDYGLTSGWRTKDMCQPPKANCIDTRPLYPQRNIDYGFTRDHMRVKKEVQPRFYYDFRYALILIILIIAILLILKR